MIVGTLELTFLIHDCHSLKQKRSIIRRLIGKVQGQFKASCAETDFQNSHQKGQIGIAMVSSDHSFLNSLLDKIEDYIEDLYLVEIIDSQIDIIH